MNRGNVNLENSVVCIIVNYNNAKEAIAQLVRIEQYNAIDAIIVVDNCSTDNSYEQLKEYVNEKIYVIRSERNGGYGYGNNYGIKFANETLHAGYALIANPDAFFHNSSVVCLKDVLSRTQCAAATVLENITRDNAWKKISKVSEVLCTGLLYNKIAKPKVYPSDFLQGKELEYVYAVQGSFLMVNVQLMLQYGMYDEDIFLYQEEEVLAAKFNQAGLQSAIVLTDTYEHRHDRGIETNIRKNVKYHKIYLQSKALYLQRYRKFNPFQMILAKVFFQITIAEIIIWTCIKKVKNWSK